MMLLKRTFQRLTIVDDYLYDNMFVSPSVTGVLPCFILVSWKLEQAAIHSVPGREVFTADMIFWDQIIDQTSMLRYFDVSDNPTRCMFRYNEASSISSITPHSSLKRRQSAYHHISDLVIS
jgi:hypothetical protein